MAAILAATVRTNSRAIALFPEGCFSYPQTVVSSVEMMHVSKTTYFRNRLRVSSWFTFTAALLALQAAALNIIGQSNLRVACSSALLLLLLIAATKLYVKNALASNHAIRLFWLLLAIGAALWAIDPLLEILHAMGRIIPGPTASASLLFLQPIVILAAVVSYAYIKHDEHRYSGNTLNCLLLLFFWIFVYCFLLSSQHLSWDSSLIQWFARLYLVETIVLMVAISVLIMRACGFWKGVYASLLAGTALHTAGFLIIHLRDAGGLNSHGWVDLLGAGAACFLIRAAMPGGNPAQQPTQSTLPVHVKLRAYTSLAALLILSTFPMLPVIKLLLSGTDKASAIRLFTALMSGLLLALTAFITEYLDRRGLALDDDLVRETAMSNARLDLALEAGGVGVWDVDVESGMRTQLGSNHVLFKSARGEESIHEFLEWVHPDDRARVRQTLESSKREKTRFSEEFRVLGSDGSLRWLCSEGKFLYSQSGHPERMLGTTIDVTKRKHAEEVLQKIKQEFSLAFEAAHIGWWVWNEETDRVIASEGTKAVLGLPPEPEIAPQVCLNSVHPEDRDQVYGTWQQSLEAGTHYFVEYRVLRPDGTIRWVESRGDVYSRPGGRYVQMIGVCMDITERKRSEETLRSLGGRLIEAQERERTRIARELHDDICQRLAILEIEVERIKYEPELQRPELQQNMDQLAELAREIGSDLQSLSHELHSSKLEILGTVAAMRSFCAEFARQHNAEVEFTSSNVPLPLSREVSICLYRVLQEALHNALKHSGVRHFEAHLRGGHGAIELTIRDSGNGFNPEMAARGQGLGLISMRERINLLNGTMLVESLPRWGTTIRARVPVGEEYAAKCA
jgi:PAS domain S-box-containing protein